MVNAVSTTKAFQTTKHTKATKGSDNHGFKLRVPFDLAQGMLRAFVVETLSTIFPTGLPVGRHK
jgi:hypothetical protein